ncbi:MAG: hypothetical protein IKR84_06825 [Oscillibacter sp.]|nr:hypothetical protein [Oscillibacter sp.]
MPQAGFKLTLSSRAGQEGALVYFAIEAGIGNFEGNSFDLCGENPRVETSVAHYG